MSAAAKILTPAFQAKRQELRDTRRKFQKACGQLSLLNKRMNDLKRHHKKAVKQRNHMAVYNLRLRMSVTEGVREKFNEYIYARAEDVTMLQYDLKFWKGEKYVTSDDEYTDIDEE